jgi:riboflavin synthase
MFTGIIAATGEVVKVEPGPDDRRIWIRSELLADCAVGASVAVDGVCLTVTELDADVCRFDVSAESLVRSTLGVKAAGDRVNLERPLRAGDELGGHIVQGHVDGVGEVLRAEREGEGFRIAIEVPSELGRYIVEKGSVTVDGVSLTATNVRDDVFEVALVPHTLEVTTFGEIDAGRRVNIEVDVLAKYAERLHGRSEAS